MSRRKCDYCRQRDVSDAFICSHCMSDVRKDLGLVAKLDLDVELPLAITRQARYSANGGGRGNTETPVVFAVKASAAERHLRNTLSTWCRVYAEEAKADLPADTLTAMARSLARRCEWFRHHLAAAQFVADVRRDVEEAIRQIDSPENRTEFVVGPCPELDDEGLHCFGWVKAYFPTDDARPHLTCTVCKTTWFGESWLRAGRRILSRLAEVTGGA